MTRKFTPLVGILVLLVVCLSAAQAQSTPGELQAALKGKPLFLRGMWADHKLTFAADGTPAQSYEPAPFTESAVDVRSVKEKKDRVEINCQRVGLAFDAKGLMRRVPMDGLKIEIMATPGTDLSQAREKIFANDLSDLYPQIPGYWRMYFQHHVLATNAVPPTKPSTAAPSAKSTTEGVHHVSGTVKPPVVIYQVDPQYGAVARAERFSGFVTIYLWVNEDGTPSHFQISKPAGLGLDEQALAAVALYKFRPATQDGKPVKVDLFIDVNFQIM